MTGKQFRSVIGLVIYRFGKNMIYSGEVWRVCLKSTGTKRSNLASAVLIMYMYNSWTNYFNFCSFKQSKTFFFFFSYLHRNVGLGMSSAISRIGSMISPFAALLVSTDVTVYIILHFLRVLSCLTNLKRDRHIQVSQNTRYHLGQFTSWYECLDLSWEHTFCLNVMIILNYY